MNKKIGFGKKRLIAEIINQTWKTDDPTNMKFSFKDILYILQELGENEGVKYLEKKTDNRGYNVFRDFTNYVLYRNLANYDSLLLLTSDKGTGKSNAAIMIARQWCSLLGIRFNPAKHLAYSNNDVMRKIDELPKFSPLVADESVRFASSADWNKSESKQLRKKIAEVRTKHMLFILCFPLKIYKMEKTYLESFTNYWCDLFGRGLGAIYVKDKNPVNDSWRMKDFKLTGSYTEFTNLREVEKKLKKHPNFWKIIKFPKAPDWLYNRYLKVREDNVYNDEQIRDSVTSVDIHKALLILALQDVMMNDTSLNMNRIMLHIKNTYDIPITKNNIQNLLLDSKNLITKIREENLK